MAVIVNGKKKMIIDRSIPEIVRKLIILKKKDLLEYVKLLAEIGVDIIEVDIKSINQIGNFHKNIIYAVRIETEEDIDKIKEYNFRYVIINYNLARDMKNRSIANLNNWKIILEIDIEKMNGGFSNENYEILNNFNISSIRFSNVKKCSLYSWNRFIKNIKNQFSVLIDFCPQNEYFAATAIAIESCLDGADFITTAFNGEKYGFAGLEEVILALKVISNGKFTGDLKLLSRIKIIYEKLINQKIFSMKPVLGEDIFKYESGIHVDGIEKNEKTYEPYSPYEIGSKRQMFIGKHSGKKAVITKLTQLNLDPNNIDTDELLRNIRSKSVNLRRSILDKELIKLYANMTNKI